jgi:cytochrome c-type biogenesis protein CcmH/NrfG
MAKESKAVRVALPPQLRKPLLFGLAILALLAGTLILWQGVQAWRQSQIAPQLDALRDRLAKQASEQVTALRARLSAAVSDAFVRADLEAGAYDDAAAKVRESWSELRSIEFR